MLRPLLFSSLFLLTCAWLHAQTMGRILDADGRGVEYANVYAPSVERGTVTERDGSFELDLAGAGPQDQVRVSCIGYADRRLSVAEFHAAVAKTQGLVLADAKYALAEATILAKRKQYQKTKTLGNATRNGKVNVVYSIENEILRGSEYGNLMENKRPAWLQTIGVNINETSRDTIHFEVNVYDWTDGQVGAQLHEKRIFWTLTKEDIKGPLQLNVRDFGIYPQGDFLVTVETLDPVDAEYQVQWSGRLLKRMTYGKNSDGEWQKFPFPVAIGLYAVVLQ